MTRYSMLFSSCGLKILTNDCKMLRKKNLKAKNECLKQEELLVCHLESKLTSDTADYSMLYDRTVVQMNIQFSQGSVAMHLRGGGKF